jgi:hypothetical protein
MLDDESVLAEPVFYNVGRKNFKNYISRNFDTTSGVNGHIFGHSESHESFR